MTKSTITRDRLEQLANFKGAPVTRQEEQELARMALAAMDSESGCLPLDYLQGHKDGLEWASQLAEANHPETGDWLYDDPTALAKAIRKGPDMPPAQPVEYSEPVAWMHNNNDIGIPAITTSQKIGQHWMAEFKDVQPLYRHAQQPVDSEPVGYLFHNEYGAVLYSISDDATEGFSLIGPIYSVPQPAPVVPNGLRLALSNAGIAAPESDEMLAATCEKHIQALVTWVKDRKPFQSAPVVPSFEEWLSAANRKPLGWVKDAMREASDACRAAMLAAAPQSPGSEPATVPGKWIPVSERMPENDGAYLCWDNRYVTTYAFIFGAWQANQFIAKNITHWMPLPAGPQGVKGE